MKAIKYKRLTYIGIQNGGRKIEKSFALLRTLMVKWIRKNIQKHKISLQENDVNRQSSTL